MSSLTTQIKPTLSSADPALHDYQSRAVQFIKDTPKCALWMDMGLGKTVTTLTALSDLLQSVDVRRILVIAPVRVIKTTWPEEIAKWPHLNHISYQLLNGTKGQRNKLVASDQSDIHLISRDVVRTVCLDFRQRWPYDCVVIDESSAFKNHSAKRFRELRVTLEKNEVPRVIQLTGTPTSNGLLDLWSQIYLLDQGQRLERSFTRFRDKYFSSDYMGYNWLPMAYTEKAVHEKVRDITLSLAAEDYLKLPARIDNTVKVILPDRNVAEYRELEREFLLELEDSDIEAVSAAALSNKLLQYANGVVYDENGDSQQMHTAKITALQELVGEIQEPMLVAYNYKSDLAALKKAFPHAVTINEKDAIDRWNAGEVDMLLAHPASAGHGLNLQHGGRVLVWYGLNWSLELYQQFNARLHRQGQTKPVMVHHLVTEGTVDEAVMLALSLKHATQKNLLEAVKLDIKGRLAA